MEYLWPALIALYVLLACGSFWPSLKAIRAPVTKADVEKSIATAHAAFDAAPHFTDEQKSRLKRHYDRLAGTLIFWKVNAKKYRLIHFYCLLWTIPSAVLIPVLTQSISDNAVSKAFVTIVSAFTAVLLALHRGFKIEDNYKGFRHGESEYYDLYRRLLDSPKETENGIDGVVAEYIAETETIRRFVRNAETSNLATLDEAKSMLQSTRKPPAGESQDDEKPIG